MRPGLAHKKVLASVYPFDDLVAPLAMARPSFIKVDVEGAELPDMAKTLRQHRP